MSYFSILNNYANIIGNNRVQLLLEMQRDVQTEYFMLTLEEGKYFAMTFVK
jgi:hypothetical protein